MRGSVSRVAALLVGQEDRAIGVKGQPGGVMVRTSPSSSTVVPVLADGAVLAFIESGAWYRATAWLNSVIC